MVDVWTPLGRRQISTPDEEWQRDQERFRQQAAAQMAMQQEALKAQREMEGGRLALARETTTPWQADQSFRAGLLNKELEERKRTTPGWDQAAWLQERLQGSFADRTGAQERLQGSFADKSSAEASAQERALAAQERIAGLNMGPNQTFADIAKEKFGRQTAEEDRLRQEQADFLAGKMPWMTGIPDSDVSAMRMMTAGKRLGFDPSEFIARKMAQADETKSKKAQAAALLQSAGLGNMARDFMDPNDPMAQVSEQVGAQMASGEPTEIPGIGQLATQLESEFKTMYDADVSDFGKDPDETDQQNFIRKWERAMQQIQNSVPPQAQARVAQRMFERLSQIIQKGEGRGLFLPGGSIASPDATQSMLTKMRNNPIYNKITGGN